MAADDEGGYPCQLQHFPEGSIQNMGSGTGYPLRLMIVKLIFISILSRVCPGEQILLEEELSGFMLDNNSFQHIRFKLFRVY